MSDSAAQKVCNCMFDQTTAAGETIIKQGENGDIVYVVESGEYDVFLEQACALAHTQCTACARARAHLCLAPHAPTHSRPLKCG